MKLGLIGALGGVGQAFINEADDIRKSEAEDARFAKEKNLQTWLMQARDEYAIKSEARAEGRAIAGEQRRTTAEIAADERKYANEQTRAPEVRARTTADADAKRSGELKFESDNIAALAKNKGAIAEASETQSTKDLRRATADAYRGKAEASQNNGKLPPALKAELHGLDDEIKQTSQAIEKAKISGEWTGSADQKGIESGLAAKRLRRSALLQDAEKSTSRQDDPLGLKPTGPTNKSERAMKADIESPLGADPYAIAREIEAAQSDLGNVNDPDDRESLTGYLSDLNGQLAALKTGAAIPARPAAAFTPATSATSAAPARPALPRSIGQIRGAVDNSTAVKRGIDLLPENDPRVAALRASISR